MFVLLEKLYPNLADYGVVGLLVLINFMIIIKFLKTLEAIQEKTSTQRTKQEEIFYRHISTNQKQFLAVIEGNTKAINQLEKALNKKQFEDNIKQKTAGEKRCRLV
jgi:biopolymer transport protein ExbD